MINFSQILIFINICSAVYYEVADFEMDISNYGLPIILNDIFRDNRFFVWEYQNNKYTFEGVIFYKK